jgi:hypothetical protein
MHPAIRMLELISRLARITACSTGQEHGVQAAPGR